MKILNQASTVELPEDIPSPWRGLQRTFDNFDGLTDFSSHPWFHPWWQITQEESLGLAKHLLRRAFYFERSEKE
ncbi:MAG: hypothetical protein U1E51_14560 [Candidatus Binatia bacterium]|nr:hypothetical protein [Candidatus Binatia bacterium]